MENKSIINVKSLTVQNLLNALNVVLESKGDVPVFIYSKEGIYPINGVGGKNFASGTVAYILVDEEIKSEITNFYMEQYRKTFDMFADFSKIQGIEKNQQVNKDNA